MTVDLCISSPFRCVTIITIVTKVYINIKKNVTMSTMTIKLKECNVGYMKQNERIRALRNAAGLSQEKIGEVCGVNRVSITKWERDPTVKINGDSLLKLSKAVNCTPEYILYGEKEGIPYEGAKAVTSNISEVGVIYEWSGSTQLEDDEVEVPFYKEVELAAGSGSLVKKENSGFKLRFAKSTLKRYNVDASCAACVTVSGDSMEPVLPDKATVGINTANTKLKDGSMYAIDHDGFLRVKVIHRLPSGGIRLRSFNRDEYPDEDYDSEQSKDIKVLGSVFWYSVMVSQ